MLINSVIQEFWAGPVSFATSIATFLSIAGAILLSALSSLTPIRLGKWTFKLATPALRVAAALLWAIAIPLTLGAIVGIAFALNWIVGTLVIPIALLLATTVGALVSGTLMQSWISTVCTVRRDATAQDEWFVGLTSVTEFTSLWILVLSGSAIIATAAGLAGPWLALLGEVERAYPDQGMSVLTGIFSVVAFATVSGLMLPIIGQIATAVFTAQSGIRWAGALAPSQPPLPSPPPSRTARQRTPSAARKRRETNPTNPNLSDQSKA